jgi:cytochrome c-type biogenesis protein
MSIMDFNNILLALGSGLFSFSMPCNLIALPSFLIYLSMEGVSMKKAFFYVLIYGLGFISVFTMIGIALLFIPGFLITQKYIQIVGGVIIMVIGVVFALGWFTKKIDTPQSSSPLESDNSLPLVNPELQNKPLSYTRCFALGISLGTSGFSCVLPVFSPILVLIATSGNLSVGVLLLISYCVGILIPYIVLGLFIGKFNEKVLVKLIHIAPILRRVFGIILIVLGFLYIYPTLVILGVI